MSPPIASPATTADALQYSQNTPVRSIDRPQLPVSAVSWGAIVAGAAAAAALSLIMLMLGTGLGFSVVSPWDLQGISAKTFGISAILWLALTQILASGMGGFLAGRLRAKWVDAGTDELFFRDTAHGFLAWCIATLATAALFTTVIGSIVGGGVQAAAEVAGGGVQAASEVAMSDKNNPAMGYFVDSLFRKSATTSMSGTPLKSATGTDQNLPTAEVSSIFLTRLPGGALPPQDASYVSQIVAQHTGLSQADAEKRVRETYAHLQTSLNEAEAAAKTALDKARKTSAYVSLWLFISLLIGAFTASLAATHGGRCRDEG